MFKLSYNIILDLSFDLLVHNSKTVKKVQINNIIYLPHRFDSTVAIIGWCGSHFGKGPWKHEKIPQRLKHTDELVNTV